MVGSLVVRAFRIGDRGVSGSNLSGVPFEIFHFVRDVKRLSREIGSTE